MPNSGQLIKPSPDEPLIRIVTPGAASPTADRLKADR
jgi:hypothetical protein